MKTEKALLPTCKVLEQERRRKEAERTKCFVWESAIESGRQVGEES